MGDTLRLDFVSTKAAIKGAAVVQGYLETGTRVLDAVPIYCPTSRTCRLGANDTNTC